MSEGKKEEEVPVAITEEKKEDEKSKEATPVVEDEQAEFKRFLESEENRKRALELADQIEQICGSDWFPLERFVKRSSESKQTAFQKLKLCEMFGLAIIRLGDSSDNRKHNKQPLFKITISAKDKIEGYDRIISYHQDQVRRFTAVRNILLSSLEEAKNKQ